MAKRAKSKSRRFQDDFQHELFLNWHKHRSQARFRGEGYNLKVEDFFKLWQPDLWQRRGRKRDELCLIRQDENTAWSLDNCRVVTRLYQLRRTNSKRKISDE